MKTIICSVLICLPALLAAASAFCDSKTVTYKISLTIPNSISLNPIPQRSNQAIQVDQLVRNNKTVIIHSVVSP